MTAAMFLHTDNPPPHITFVGVWFRFVLEYLSFSLSEVLLHTYLVLSRQAGVVMSGSFFSRPSHGPESNGDVYYELSKADEIAPRAYVRQMFCFEFNGSQGDEQEAISRLRQAVIAVQLKWPHLSGMISQHHSKMSKGSLELVHNQSAYSSGKFMQALAVKHLTEEEFPHSYQQLRDAGFPLETAAKGTVLHHLGPLASGIHPTPVFSVQMNFIRGGLILAIYLHHSVGDGNCMGNLVNTLAACTRMPALVYSQLPSQPEHPTLRSEEFEQSIISAFEDHSWEELLADCPEYTLLPRPTGPFQPDLTTLRDLPQNPPTGKIFQFPVHRIKALKDLCNNYLKQTYGMDTFVSSNDCMCALLTAHTTNIRTRYYEELTRSGEHAYLTVPIDYRNVVKPALQQAYFGNAVCLARTAVPVATLQAASKASLYSAESVNELAEVALALRRSVKAIDDTYVRKRLALAHKIPDIRCLGLSANLELDVTYNTWAPYGGDADWQFCSDPSVHSSSFTNGEATLLKAEAVRRGYYEHNLIGHLTLPRQHDSPTWEVIVQLRQSHMHDLLSDTRFMQFVDRVVSADA